MRDTKELVRENNEKRELLTKENEKLYSDFLLYIRTNFKVSEQEGEEILMDILDHLLAAQEEGRTAEDLFGDDPKAYADELIELLPSPKKRSVAVFAVSQVFSFAAWYALGTGTITGALSFFTDYEYSFRLGTASLIVLFLLAVIYAGIKLIFSLIRSSLFRKKPARGIYWKAGLFGSGSMALVMLLLWILPDFGPELTLQWYVYLALGVILLGIGKLAERAQ